jgi:hypothetical protein
MHSPAAPVLAFVRLSAHELLSSSSNQERETRSRRLTDAARLFLVLSRPTACARTEPRLRGLLGNGQSSRELDPVSQQFCEGSPAGENLRPSNNAGEEHGNLDSHSPAGIGQIVLTSQRKRMALVAAVPARRASGVDPLAALRYE